MTDDINTPATQKSVVIERSIAAPVAAVWQMWVEADRFASWYGPAGATVPVARFDVRAGGSRFVEMQLTTPDGSMTMWFTGKFCEVDEPHRLVYTEVMCDESGAPMPGPGGTVTETQVEVTFAAIGDTTRLVLTHHGIPADSPGATGWTMALDQLDARLAEQ